MLWFPTLPELQTDACRATAQSVRQGAALVVVEGVATRAYHAWLRDVLKRLIATHHTLELFVDARRLRAYHAGVRAEEAELLLRFRKRVPAMRVLVRSRLQALGLSVVDLTLSGCVHAYSSVTKFQATLAPAVPPEAYAIDRAAPESGRRVSEKPRPAGRDSEHPASAPGEGLLGERRRAAGY